MKIGLTGGIASGKSTVSTHLSSLGATIIDADQITHQLMRAGEIIWRRIVEEFGEEILLKDNSIDRRRLGSIIFNDQQARERLNNITHPIIIAIIKERLNHLEESETIVIADIPLLIEVGIVDFFDEIWLAYVNQDLQLQRLMKRDRIKREAALAKINSQMSLDKKKEYADRIIENNGTRQELRVKVEQIWLEVNSV